MVRNCCIGICGGIIQKVSQFCFCVGGRFCLLASNGIEGAQHGVVNCTGIKLEGADNFLDEGAFLVGEEIGGVFRCRVLYFGPVSGFIIHMRRMNGTFEDMVVSLTEASNVAGKGKSDAAMVIVSPGKLYARVLFAFPINTALIFALEGL